MIHFISSGGISGKFSDETVNVWCESFAFRSVLSSITNEIAAVERENNTIDAHAECGPSRRIQDDHDLTIILERFLDEDLFGEASRQVRTMMNGKIIDQMIIDNVTQLYDRGLEAMYVFILERYVDQSKALYDSIPRMIRLKLSDSLLLNEDQQKKKVKRSLVMNKVVQTADIQIRDIVSLSHFRVCSFASFKCCI